MKKPSIYAASVFALSAFLFSCGTVNMNRFAGSDMETVASKPRISNEIVATENNETHEAVITKIAIEEAPVAKVENNKKSETSSKNIETFSAGLKELVASSENNFARKSLTRTSNTIDKLVGNKEKLNFLDKFKLKIFSKILNRYVEKYGSEMEGADILAIISLVAGILTWMPFYSFFFFGLAALIIGIIALKQGTSRRGMALAGLILGTLGLFIFLLLLIAALSGAITFLI